MIAVGDQQSITIDCSPWAGRDVTIEISHDDGATWDVLGNAVGCAPDSSITVFPPMLCECGAPYQPGDVRYTRSLLHSTIALRPGVFLQQMRRRVHPMFRWAKVSDFQTRIATDRHGNDIDDSLFVRAFHAPAPASGRRLLRMVD